MTVKKSQNVSRSGVYLAALKCEELGLLFREQDPHDHGIDAHIELVQDDEPTGSLIAVQIKSGKSYFSESTADGWILRVDSKHADYWLGHSLPVVAMLCDVENREIYWQAVRTDTLQATEKNYKLLVPRTQALDNQSLSAIRRVGSRIVPPYEYSITRQSDVSHGLAKRYDLAVVLNKTLSKPEIAAVVRQVVADHRDSSYYRDEMVETHWQNSSAHVISIFVYPSLEDQENNNWICRAQWIDESLPDDSAPLPLKGENIGHDIIADWSNNYSSNAGFYRQHTTTKEDYLRAVKRILAELQPLVEEIRLLIASETATNEVSDSVTAHLRLKEPDLSRLYSQGSSLGLAPIECREVDHKFQAVVSLAHNFTLPFLEAVKNRERNLALDRLTLRDYQREMEALRYEMKKIR